MFKNRLVLVFICFFYLFVFFFPSGNLLTAWSGSTTKCSCQNQGSWLLKQRIFFCKRNGSLLNWLLFCIWPEKTCFLVEKVRRFPKVRPNDFHGFRTVSKIVEDSRTLPSNFLQKLMKSDVSIWTSLNYWPTIKQFNQISLTLFGL